MVELKVAKGKINFKCLKNKCPKSCCGKFNGDNNGNLIPISSHGFSDIPLSNEVIKFIRRKGGGE